MKETTNDRLAVLIDADNFSARWCEGLFNEIAKFGVATVKRAYADWTVPHVSGWRDKLARNAIAPIQQFSYVKGKNSTDAALIIDAMDLLHAGNLDGFCLVSSRFGFHGVGDPPARRRRHGLRVRRIQDPRIVLGGL